MIKHHHYKSDCVIVETFYNCRNGCIEQVAVPERIRLEYYIDPDKGRIIVERIGAVSRNCALSNDGMSLIVTLPLSKSPIGQGMLLCDKIEYIKDSRFSSGYKTMVTPSRANIKLWSQASDEDNSTNLGELVLSTVFQGKPGENGVGVPSGGKEGQVLVKISDKPYDTKWGNLPKQSAEINIDAEMSNTSVNPVQNKAIKTYVDESVQEVSDEMLRVEDVASAPDSFIQGERLILEWSNEDAEILQPTAYNAETGYFTVEQMPSWLSEDGVSVNAVINYTDAILYGSASSKNVVIGSDAGRSTLWVKRISETQFLCHIGQQNMTAATVPSTVDPSLFYFTKTIYPAFQLLKEGETSPTIGVRKFHIRITDIAARESKYTQLWLNGSPQHTQGSNDYSKYPAAAIGHFSNKCFGAAADMEVWVDYGAEGGPIGKFVRIDSDGVYFDNQQNLGYYTNPTLYSKWGGMWGFSTTKQCYLRVTALGKRATVRITEITE